MDKFQLNDGVIGERIDSVTDNRYAIVTLRIARKRKKVYTKAAVEQISRRDVLHEKWRWKIHDTVR